MPEPTQLPAPDRDKPGREEDKPGDRGDRRDKPEIEQPIADPPPRKEPKEKTAKVSDDPVKQAAYEDMMEVLVAHNYIESDIPINSEYWAHKNVYTAN